MVLRRDAGLMERGAERYGDGESSPLKQNWMKGQPLSWYYGSILSHTMAVGEGQEDEDHLAAIRWNAMAFMWTLNEIRLGNLPLELNDMGYDVHHPVVKQTVEGAAQPGVGAAVDKVISKQLEIPPTGTCPSCHVPGFETADDLWGCSQVSCDVIEFNGAGEILIALNGNTRPDRFMARDEGHVSER